MKHLARIMLCAALFGGLTGGRSLAAEGGARSYVGRSDDWFKGDEAKRITANILSYQAAEGGWPKNVDTAAAPYAGNRADLKGTFDNGATTDELRFLARAFDATKDDTCRAAFGRGLDHILKAQYPTGGWPQFYPPSTKYHRHITFNDDAMVRLMLFLRECYSSPVYGFIDDAHKASARKAFDAGIQCILKCQIKVNGKLTAWCAQHDEIDYSPRPGRAYELASLSGGESVGIVKLLMSLDNPGPEVIRSITSAVAWFESAKLPGIRVDEVPDPKAPKGVDRVVVKDAAAAPMWARFYNIETNQPIFCDRDGVPKASLAEIGYERRNGYRWLNYWGAPLLKTDYPAWKAKWANRIDPALKAAPAP